MQLKVSLKIEKFNATYYGAIGKTSNYFKDKPCYKRF